MTVSDRKTLKNRSTCICIAVLIMVVATGTVMLGIHFTVKEIDDIVTPKNVLLIVVDDLRPTLRCYGDKVAITPNIDKLSQLSIKFNKAYVQQALCAPSRNSFLISRRPDTIHLYDTHNYWRKTVGNFTTLPQHFKERGFFTVSLGKIFHPGTSSGDTDDFPYSWSKKPYHPSTLEYEKDKVCEKNGEKYENLYCPVNVNDQPGKTLPDLQTIDQARAFLENYPEEIDETSKPFFLAVGLHKPHIPFRIPEQYITLYPHVDLAPNRQKPKEMPDVAWNPWMDIRSRHDVQELNVSFPYGPIPDSYQEYIKKGYYAAVSYIDDLIGKLLFTLEEKHFIKNTLIILVGDHGWSLGEHQEWAKYSNFEDVVNVPLMIYIPNLVKTKGKIFKYESVTNLIEKRKHENETVSNELYLPFLQSDELVELVDLFPTISDLMQLDVPPICPKNSKSVQFCSEGISLKPLIKHLIDRQKYTSIKDFVWKKAAFSQYPRPSLTPQENSDQPDLNDINIMGYSMKTKNYRYTEWIEFSPKTFLGNWSNIYAKELYIHSSDPKENKNEANNPKYKDIIKQLSEQLKKGWRFSLPPQYMT